MAENIFLGSILIFFILAFFIKNIKTYFATGGTIRGKSLKVTFSLVLSTLIYLILFFRLTFSDAKMMSELNLGNFLWIKGLAYTIISIGFVLGILALIAMKNSWRVGIVHESKTELITSGIYKFSRNPYFLSYDILILGYVLFFPSWILIVLYLSLIFTFHAMIREEEVYLLKTHGDQYVDFQKKVNRYITV